MNVVTVLKNKPLVEYIGDLTLNSDGSYRGVCPFHAGATNPTSFAVFPQTNSFYCFSCGEGGDIIKYKMLSDGVGYDAAIVALCDEYGLELDEKYKSQKSISDKNEAINNALERNIKNVYNYLVKDRGLTADTIKKYRLGYSTKWQCLTIPMFDEYGRIVAFGYRFFSEDMPKYKNSKNNELFVKGEYLYNINFALQKLRKTKRLYITEGFFDSISADQQGEACVSYCGITFGKKHVEMIRKICEPVNAKIILVPDEDGKACKFVRRGRDLFKSLYPKANVSVATLGEQHGIKDFNELLVAGGKISEVKTIPIDFYCAKQILKENPDDRQAQELAIVDFINTVSSPVIKADIAEMLAGAWNKDIEVVKELLSVESDTVEEQLNDFNDFSTCFNALASADNTEDIGLAYQDISNTITLRKKDVFIISAASFSGKTEFAIENILYWVIKKKKRVIFFSMELPKENVAKIIVSKICGVPKHMVNDFIKNNPNVHGDIMEKMGKYLYVVDKNNLSMEDIERYINLANARVFDSPTDIIVVDYFTYMKNVDTIEKEAATARKMKAIAKEHNIVFTMLSQFSKAGQATDKGKFIEPTLTSLRGSSDIGNSGDLVIAMWRPALVAGLSDIDKEEKKFDTCMKVLKCREVKSPKVYFNFRYDINTGRLNEYEG